MTKDKTIKTIITALLLASPMAGAETQYPEPFEPKVLYQDAEYIANHPGPAAEAPKAEAPAPAASTDTRYPNAFEPKVLYRDAEYISSHPKAAAAPPTKAAEPAQPKPAEPAESKPEAPVAAEPKGNFLSENALTFLIFAGIVGYVFWSGRGSKKCAHSPKPETGVAKYLKRIENETGVARYLRTRGIS